MTAFDYEDFLCVQKVFLSNKKTFGARRINMALERGGISMSLNKVRRIMKKYNLVTHVRKVRPYKKAPKATIVTTAENILNREFVQQKSRRFFCTDITFIPWNGNFVYLSTIKDIGSGEIVGWKCSQNIDMQLALDSLAHFERNMLTHIFSARGAIMHSDRGSHYTGPQWDTAMSRMGMVRSMSRVGRCVDNAPMESFFGHMKDDLSFTDCLSFDEVAFRVDQYMRYYNNDRPQWGKKKMTPVEYGNHLLTH